ncbi:hypothetical protein MAHJHV47_43730 [Mycobacterium avium subsp. hominissuis]|jgi:hypothetical protein
MKRKVPASSTPPPELLTFDPEHWTHEAWCNARAAWAAAGGFRAWRGRLARVTGGDEHSR